MESKQKVHPLARKHLAQVQPYSSAQHEFSGRDQILLNANENPFGGEFCRYPDSSALELGKAYLEFLNQDSLVQENLLFTNGSDEAIDLLIRGFCEPETDSVLITSPSFTMYNCWAAANNVNIEDVPLEGEGLNQLNVEKILESSAKILFLCNPNNPVGSALDLNQVQEVLEKFKGIVVLDEAYQEFSSQESGVSWLREFPNLVVLRTFSKAWGMAGLRCGIAIAAPEILDVLLRIKAPYNVNSAAQSQALRALASKDLLEKQQVILRERENMKNFFLSRPEVLKVFESETNFLLVQFKVSPQGLYQNLLDQGVVVRDRCCQVSNTLRFTIGTKEENEKVRKLCV